MSKLANQWIDLFAAGNYGDRGSFTEQDVQGIAASYDPAHHEAPVVIGHPKSNGPAFGWVSKLRTVGGKLQGMFGHVNPAFEEMVENGAFKKRSISLYKGDKGWSLRHVGFLGAQPPEIKGLADVKFGDEDQKAIAIEFAEEKSMDNNDTIVQRITDAIKGLLAGKSPEVAAAATFSEADVTRIATETAAAAIKPLQAKLDEQATQFSEREQKISTGETKQRAATAISAVKAKGAWVPAFDKMGLSVVFEELAKQDAVVEFGEGDQKVSKKPLAILQEFMEGIGRIVPAGTTYGGQKADGAPDTSKINTNGRAKADLNSVRLHEFAESIRRERKIESYTQALEIAVKEKPELTQPDVAGAV